MISQQSVYFIGIGGSGSSALALLLKKRGVAVSGTDVASSATVRLLRSAGIRITVGLTKKLPPKIELIVFSPAVPTNNRLLAQARKRTVLCLSYPQALWQEIKDKRVIAVAGTHGKSTVTALVGWFLYRAKLDPTIVVGAVMLNFKSNARAGRGQWAVIEADEFAHSFHAYQADRIIVNNVEPDHFDTYPNRAKLRQGFQRFVDGRRRGATVILNHDDPAAASLRATPRLRFSLRQASNIRYGARRTWFSLGRVRFVSPLPGRHNIANVIAAVTAVRDVGVSVQDCAKALAHFRGTWRRFERVGRFRSADVISDYAHHPTEISATIASARQQYPGRQIVVVFQPHQHNRTRHLARAFGQALRNADTVILTEIFRVAGRIKSSDRRVSARLIIPHCHTPVFWAPTFAHIKRRLNGLPLSRSVILCLGAGDIDTFARKLGHHGL